MRAPWKDMAARAGGPARSPLGAALTEHLHRLFLPLAVVRGTFLAGVLLADGAARCCSAHDCCLVALAILGPALG
jgi:hypothetical protein